MKKHFVLYLSLLLVLISALTGCGAKSEASAYYTETSAAAFENSSPGYYKSDSAEYAVEETAGWYEEDMVSPAETAAEDETALPGFAEAKLVYTCDMSIETVAFDDTMSAVRDLIDRYSGFIAEETMNDNDNYWYYSDYVKNTATLSGTLTVRIPSENYTAFLDDMQGCGKITAKNMYVENISRKYSETETTIRSLETQEQRLLDMMEQCETVEDMIAVEARLSEVQNELKLCKNSLSSMDTDVAYSTVTLRIHEVLEYTPDREPVKTLTFGDRLKNTLKETGEGFLDFLEGLLFFLINAFPYLLILAAITVAIVLSVKKKLRKNRNRLPEEK